VSLSLSTPLGAVWINIFRFFLAYDKLWVIFCQLAKGWNFYDTPCLFHSQLTIVGRYCIFALCRGTNKFEVMAVFSILRVACVSQGCVKSISIIFGHTPIKFL